MSPKDMLYCGKDLRKYLYVIGIASLFIVVGSYWYTQYYVKGVGLHAALSSDAPLFSHAGTALGVKPLAPQMPGTLPVAQRFPISSRQTDPQPYPQSFPQPFPQEGFQAVPRMQQVAAVSAVPPGGFSRVARKMMSSIVNVSATRDPQATGVQQGTFQQGAQAGGGAVVPQPGVAPNAGGGMRFAQPFSGTAFESVGSGIVVTDDGYILTNNHVVEKSRQVFVTAFERDGTTMRYHADVVAMNAKRELALLKVDPMRPMRPARLGNAAMTQVGDPVIAIGSPFGLDQTVSQGIISGKRNAITIEGVVHKNLLQTDAAINRGNSGGPLVNGKGQVIGVNTAIYTPNGAFAGIGFAVPIERAQEFMEEYIVLPVKTVPAAAPATPPVAAPPIYANAPSPHEDRGPCEMCHQILAAPGGGAGVMAPVAAQPPMAPPIYADAVMPHEDRGPCESCHQILPPAAAVPQGVGVGLRPGGPGAGAGPLPGHTPGAGGGYWWPQHYSRHTGTNYSFSPGGAIGIPAANRVPSSGVGSAGLDLVALDQATAQRLASPYPEGVLVRTVLPGSRGLKAGFRANDIIFKVDGRWARTPEEVQGMLKGVIPGQPLRLSVVRAGQRQNLYLDSGAKGGVDGVPGTVAAAMTTLPPSTMGQMMVPRSPGGGQNDVRLPAGQGAANAPAPLKTEFEWMGMELTPISPAMKAKNRALLGKFGAMVADVDPGTQAEMAGIQVGDIVTAINNWQVPSAGALEQAITAAGTQKGILLQVERDNTRMFATLP